MLLITQTIAMFFKSLNEPIYTIPGTLKPNQLNGTKPSFCLLGNVMMISGMGGGLGDAAHM